MSPDENSQWPEHVVCARCGTPLGEHYRESPLGLRFCSDCFDGAIQEKARERAAELYVRGRCSSCGGSLINGYRMSKLGVIYCLSCFEHLPSPEAKIPKDEPGPDNRSRQKFGTLQAANMVLQVYLWTSLAAAHILFYTDSLFSVNHPLVRHPNSYFRSLVSLDLLTLLLLFAWNRFPMAVFRTIIVLLIATGFIILMGREVTVLVGW